MSQSLAQIYLHVVFSTKLRRQFLNHRPLLERLHAYMAGICKGLDCPAIVIGGVADHVHIACRLGRTIDVATLVRDLKRESSKWIKCEEQHLKAFQWQAGYGAFSVSPGHLEALKQYILHQEAHHHRESFQDEFRRLCRKYNIELDERYAWD